MHWVVSRFGLLGSTLSVCLLVACGSEQSDDPSALEYCDVEPLFAHHCTKCHNDSEDALGPMSLETYEQAFDYKRDIAIWVGNESMPLETSKYPVTLTDEERDIIVEWAKGSAAHGDCD